MYLYSNIIIFSNTRGTLLIRNVHIFYRAFLNGTLYFHHPRANPRLRDCRPSGPIRSLTSLDQSVRREQFQRVHLIQYGVEEQRPGRRTSLKISRQTLVDKVLLQWIVQRLDRAVDVVLRDQRAAVAVALYLQRGHFQGAHAKRVDVDGGRHEICNRTVILLINK